MSIYGKDIGYTDPVYNTRLGRASIYTTAPSITKENLIDVLMSAKSTHMMNVSDIRYLINYEKGRQPLNREKKVRPEIDICDIDNIANQITEFKLGYDWGYPISLVQRSNREGISDIIGILNNYYDLAGNRGKQQELARYIEITGVGYSYIDINAEYVKGDSPFTLDILDPEFTFVVRSSYYTDNRIIMAVTFSDTDEEGNSQYTCFTSGSRYVVNSKNEIKEWANPLGIIPIIEWVRAYDRMGCFERQIPEMDALNLLNSDFLNDVDQNTQAIWHANDVDFAKEEIVNEDGTVTYKTKRPENGQWLQTFTANNSNTPKITPLTINYNYSGMLNNIVNKRQTILAKCDVPQRNDNSGGSTGIAMSDASGWSAAEASASKKENIQDLCKCAELRVVFRAIAKNSKIKGDDPIRKITLADVKPYIKRQKSYEMTVKTNAFATMVSHGICGEDAINSINFFDDPSQVWERSKDTIEKYQDKVFGDEETVNVSNPQNEYDTELSSDRVTDQIDNSPNID